ncbi:MAG: NAD(P)-dependent oxidoreductase [Lachnospiraceae bacterium]|nr:NAD(P)-dependent oxidoreductase [Lachnospiraceae bacterium]MDD3614788.1 NAD(P)-dependent oxidoreductase [Lachnospiraceae bacterium]
MNNKPTLTIFQGIPELADLSYDDMVTEWKNQLARHLEIGDYHIYPLKGRMLADRYQAEIGDSDAVIGPWINPDYLSEPFFQLHPNVRYISDLGHGYESFDIDLTRKYNVTICNTPYGSNMIAQYAMALLLNICHDVSLHSQYSKSGYWEGKEQGSSRSYRQVLLPQIELYDKTIGILGLGNIGLCMANMAASMGMHVIAHSRSIKTGPQYDFIDQVSLEELLERSDIISIHCPHTPQTHHMINKETLSQMKTGVILINTARGDIIDEDALYDALEERKVYKAGLDVLTKEPPALQIPLMKSPYTYITSHIAWQSRTSRLRAVKMAVDNYVSYLHGNISHRIN